MDLPEREVLVHISAPSGARDDALHLVQAEAYLAFEPVTRTQIFPGSDDGDILGDQRDQYSGSGDVAKELRNGNEMERATGEAGLSGVELENVGPSGSAPPDRTCSNSISPSTLGSQEWSGPLKKSSKARLSQNQLRRGRGLPPSRNPCLAPENSHGISTPFAPVRALFPTSDIPTAQSLVDTDSLELPPSVVQDSQPVSLRLSGSEENQDAEYRTGLSQGRSSGGLGMNSSRSVDILLPPNKRQRLDTAGLLNQPANPTTQSLVNAVTKPSISRTHCESPDISLSQNASSCSSCQSIESIKDNSDVPSPVLPLEIHPPPPSASSAQFKSHVTPTLQMLSDRLGLSRVFNPIRKERELRLLERGYWLAEVKIVSPGTEERQQHRNDHCVWSLPLFIRFWSFLADFIGKEGRAGWGVWCVREPQNLYPGEIELHLPRVERVKVYSWGEVVPHIYLVLFLASERRIKGMCAQWKDAKDETVVRMG